MEKAKPQQQVAVWYFIGATFAFASTTLFFPDPEPWLRIATLIIGFALVVAGAFQLGRELKRPTPPSD